MQSADLKQKLCIYVMLWHNLGETDGFGVSDHVNILERYLGKGSINSVIVSNTVLPKSILEKYSTQEQKDLVKIDYENIKKGN